MGDVRIRRAEAAEAARRAADEERALADRVRASTGLPWPEPHALAWHVFDVVAARAAEDELGAPSRWKRVRDADDLISHDGLFGWFADAAGAERLREDLLAIEAPEHAAVIADAISYFARASEDVEELERLEARHLALRESEPLASLLVAFALSYEDAFFID